MKSKGKCYSKSKNRMNMGMRIEREKNRFIVP